MTYAVAAAPRLSVDMLGAPVGAEHIAIIVGSGRSGTTWVASTLATASACKVVFEPLNRRFVSCGDAFPHRPYLHRLDDANSWYRYMSAVFEGRLSGQWVDQLTPSLHTSSKLIVKEIRAGLMLEWLINRFNIKVLYIVRNPVFVVASRLRLGWMPHIDDCLKQESLMRDHLWPFERLLRNSQGLVAQHTLMWCIENFFLRSFAANQNIMLVRYEDLLQHNVSIKSILKFLNFTVADNRHSSPRPTLPHSVLYSGAAPDEIEQSLGFSRDEARMISALIDAFGVDTRVVPSVKSGNG